jgi:hypothetical protein
MQTVKNQYCLNLNLNLDVKCNFLKDFDITDVPSYGFKQFRISQSMIDTNLVQFLRSRNIDISHVEVFYTLPGHRIPIHVDTDTMDNHCKLNFVYGDAGSVMRWWRPKNPNAELKYQLTPVGTQYLYFDKDDCDLIWESQVGCPGLVNAGQPHSMFNCTNSARWAVSLVLYDLNKSCLLDWNDAADIFKDFIIS